MYRSPRLLASTAQCAAVLGALAFLALSPPATGAMLLVPLGDVSTATMVNGVVARDGALLGPGPVGGSLIVYGRRDAIRRAMGGAAVLVLAAPFNICGSPPKAGERA